MASPPFIPLYHNSFLNPCNYHNQIWSGRLGNGLLWWLTWWRICLQSRRPRFDPWVGKIPWRRHGNPLQNSCLENSRGQKSLEVRSPWGHRSRHDWAAKHSTDLVKWPFSEVSYRVNLKATRWTQSNLYAEHEREQVGSGNPLQHSCLENPTDRGAWQATVHSVTKSWTWLSN